MIEFGRGTSLSFDALPISKQEGENSKSNTTMTLGRKVVHQNPL
jgi:hypothetical protein